MTGDGYLGGRAVLLAWLLLTSLVVLENDIHVDAKSPEEKLCNLTKEFLICMDCLKGKALNLIQIPKPKAEAEAEDREKKWAGKAIDCARGSSLTARDSMINFASNSTGRLQEAAKFCMSQLESAADRFAVALKFWSYRRKSDTLQYISIGRDDYDRCVERVPSDMPLPVLHGQLNYIRARSEVAHTLIEAV